MFDSVSGSNVCSVLSESFIHLFIYILIYSRKSGILYQMIGSEIIRLLCENCSNLTIDWFVPVSRGHTNKKLQNFNMLVFCFVFISID